VQILPFEPRTADDVVAARHRIQVAALAHERPDRIWAERQAAVADLAARRLDPAATSSSTVE
jgi:hypothetical protein